MREIINKEILNLAMYEQYDISKNDFVSYLKMSGYKFSCNHCGNHRIYDSRNDSHNGTFTCNKCNNSFSIFKDTILSYSAISFDKLLKIIYYHLNYPKMSAMRMWKTIGGSYKTFYYAKQKCIDIYG